MHVRCTSRRSDLLQKALTYQAGICCLHWNPVLMRSFFRKLSILQAHGLTRAEPELLEEWGSFQLGSVNSKLLKTQALHASYPWTAICLVEEVTKKEGFASWSCKPLIKKSLYACSVHTWQASNSVKHIYTLEHQPVPPLLAQQH